MHLDFTISIPQLIEIGSCLCVVLKLYGRLYARLSIRLEEHDEMYAEFCARHEIPAPKRLAASAGGD
jgi:hypothetical protein